ncbi:hypothetical protein BVZ28_19870 [Alcaligenes faecalis]|nr:peptidoglycan-binding protein [Cupriavidus pauculus]MBO9357765.1 hypothetical protein [Bordetella petrii]OSZ29122.1 hypothetical protein BVZ28_19870 [Alcaligenes faecalis]OSZ37386.1 hypothetical protein BVZ29_19590 [Alcaligenes faecalis]UAL01566.1 peptidoglycan-binding protein [Cupriavidus pauculus]
MIPRPSSCTRLLVITAAAFFSLALPAHAQATSTEPGLRLTSARTTASEAAAAQTPGPAARHSAPTGAQAATLRAIGGSGSLTQELRYRVKSPQVRELQVRLRLAKYLALYDVDDRFGMLTREAVLKFQRDNGFRATGMVDQQTWDTLLLRSRVPTEAELNNTDVGSWFTAPEQTGYMRELQHRLRQVGLYQGAVDGTFNDTTRRAIEAWRVRMGLPAASVKAVGT